MTDAVNLAALADASVPPALVERLRNARSVIAVSHENPDADTIGAVIALCVLVEALGGRATALCSDPVPPLYAFLDGVERFQRDPSPDARYDLVVLADCATAERVGDVATRHPELFAELPRVVIDHHASNSKVGDADWVDPEAAATCELMTLLAVKVGVPLTAADGGLAAALMAGIVMDTATFAHPNATPRTLAVSAELVAAGAPLSDISRRLYRTKPDSQLRLFGRILDRLETSPDHRVIWSTLREADFAATSSIPAHSEGLIDLLAQSEAAEVAMVLKEAADGSTRLSVRTKPGGVDATVLTGVWGGGGHTRAAGATIPLPLEAAVTAARAEAERLAAAVRR
ncbi:MAG TPA: bifunctional oligoribonuclease/PAP phosphatase NrnA [Candidatus Limnocylindrales bacterium]